MPSVDKTASEPRALMPTNCMKQHYNASKSSAQMVAMIASAKIVAKP